MISFKTVADGFNEMLLNPKWKISEDENEWLSIGIKI